MWLQAAKFFHILILRFYFGVQRYAIIAKNAIYLDKKSGERRKVLLSRTPLHSPILLFTSPLIIFSAELEVSLRVLAHRAKFGSFLTDMDMTAV